MLTRLARVVMALSAVALTAQLAGAAEGVRVTAERANLRSKPNTESEIVAKVSKGTVLSVLGHEGGWVRVAAPLSGAPAYISARLCEPAASPAAAVATTPAPTAAPAPATSSASGSSFKAHGSSETEPRLFGGQLDFASSGVGFGFGARASTGLPVAHLGVLGTVDLFLGTQQIANAAGVKVDSSGHSLQFGLFPTYGYEFGDLHVYGGAGLSILYTSYSISVAVAGAPAADLSGSQWDTSLGLVAGVRYKERFFGETRYQFGGASHVTVSVGVVFGK